LTDRMGFIAIKKACWTMAANDTVWGIVEARLHVIQSMRIIGLLSVPPPRRVDFPIP